MTKATVCSTNHVHRVEEPIITNEDSSFNLEDQEDFLAQAVAIALDVHFGKPTAVQVVDGDWNSISVEETPSVVNPGPSTTQADCSPQGKAIHQSKSRQACFYFLLFILKQV